MCLLLPHIFLFSSMSSFESERKKMEMANQTHHPCDKKTSVIIGEAYYASNVLQGLDRSAVYLFAKYT